MTALDLGRKIKELRQLKGLTQKELAERAGISANYLSRIEEGNCSPPHVKTLSRIAFALNVTIREIKKVK